MKAKVARAGSADVPARVDIRGAIEQRQKGFFVLRLRVLCGNVTSAQLSKLSSISKKYGIGELHLTARQGIEIPWIRQENLENALKEAEKAGIYQGASGPRVRVVTACPGSRVCKHGQADSREFAEEIDRLFFGTELPHKFKIAVSGCPNACTKPMENDIGFSGMVEPGIIGEGCIECGICRSTCKEKALSIENGIPVIDPGKCAFCGDCIRVCPTSSIIAKRYGYRVYIGGKMGRHPRLGLCIEEFADKERGLDIIAGALDVYKKYGKPKERFRDMIDRIGLEKVKKATIIKKERA